MLIESIYYGSPRIIQEMMISIKSSLMHHKTVYPESARLIKQPDSNSARELYIKEVEDKYKDFLFDACVNVPFYRDHLEKTGVKPEEVSVYNYTDLLPVIDRVTVKENPRLFYSEKRNKKEIRIHTSGTTGEPLTIITSPEERKQNFLFFNSILVFFGITPFDKSVTIGGKVLHKRKKTTKHWRYDHYSNNLYMSNYHLNDRTALSYLGKMEEHNPRYIESYPFALKSLALAMKDNRRSYGGKSLKVIITSSEALTDDDRKLLEEVFNCPIVNQYGNVEMSVFGYSLDNQMYFPGLYSQVEFLPNENDGYEIVSTSCINSSMPLIRYRTGDNVNQLFENNLIGAITGTVHGRKEDYILLPDGTNISQFNPVAAIERIGKAQVIQYNINLVEIRYQPLPGFSKKDEDTLKSIAKSKLGPKMTVEIKSTSDFMLNNSGKFSFIKRLF